MLASNSLLPKTRIRIYEVGDEEKYLAERRQSVKLALRSLDIKQEKENLIMSAGMQSIANYMAGLQASWENLRWYAQALGTSGTTPVITDTGLNFEMNRKQFTDFSPTVGNLTGRVITANTFFSSVDYSNWASTVSNATTPSLTQASMTAVSGVPVAGSFPLAVGDVIQVQTPTQFEYPTVTAIVGNLVTWSPALVSSAPVVGATIAQMTEEAGFFGNVPAGLTAGTIAVANGGTAVTGTGTAFNSTFVGDLIRFPSSSTPRQWFTVTAIGSNTGLTIGTFNGGPATFQGTTIGSGGSYAFRGTIFNHVNLLHYQKQPTKGFVFENQWTIGG